MLIYTEFQDKCNSSLGNGSFECSIGILPPISNCEPPYGNSTLKLHAWHNVMHHTVPCNQLHYRVLMIASAYGIYLDSYK